MIHIQVLGTKNNGINGELYGGGKARNLLNVFVILKDFLETNPSYFTDLDNIEKSSLENFLLSAF